MSANALWRMTMEGRFWGMPYSITQEPIGIPPYYSNNRDQLFDNIKKGPLMLPKHNMSEDAKSLIKGVELIYIDNFIKFY